MFRALFDPLVRLADYLPTSGAALRRGIAAFRREDFAGAVRAFQPLVDAGQPAAQYHLGLMYLYGVGVAMDEGRGREHLLASADAGYGPAQGSVADCYWFGKHGFPDSWEKALAYAELAEAQGDGKGFNALLRIHESMQEHERAVALVKKWLDGPRLPEAGAAKLACRLADYYSQGLGLPVDDDKAFALYQRAAAGGNEEAQVILAALGGDSRRHRSYSETRAYLQQYVAGLPDPMPLSSCNGVSLTVRQRRLALEGYTLELSCIIETAGPGRDAESRAINLCWPMVFPEKPGPLTTLRRFDQTDADGSPMAPAVIAYLDPWDDRDKAEPLFMAHAWEDRIIPLWEAGEVADADHYEHHEFIRALHHLHRLLGIEPPSRGGDEPGAAGVPGDQDA